MSRIKSLLNKNILLTKNVGFNKEEQGVMFKTTIDLVMNKYADDHMPGTYDNTVYDSDTRVYTVNIKTLEDDRSNEIEEWLMVPELDSKIVFKLKYKSETDVLIKYSSCIKSYLNAIRT